MKKLIIYAILFLLAISFADAYSTTVSVQVMDIGCNFCASPAGLTGITGTNGILCISTTSGCTCDVVSNSIGASISETTYTTASASLTAGADYFVCLKLTETGGGFRYPLNSCSGTWSCPGFTIAGTTCGGSTSVFIGYPVATANTIIFPFQFVA